jgi:hypothetical protein
MSREKVLDDPLAAFAQTAPVVPKAAEVNPAMTANEEIRTINTDKVNLKQKPTKSAATTLKEPTESIFDPSPTVQSNLTKESKGLGFASALWDNTPISAGGDVLEGSSGVSSTDTGIFTKKSADPVVQDYSRLKSKSSTADGGKFRVAAEENDDTFEDLKVGKLVEREDTATDFELFGRTKVVQGAKGAVETQQAFSKSRKDDFDLVSNDTIANLESATVEKKAKPTTVFTSPSFLDAQVTRAEEVDLSALDINAYISQNSASEGGLFD